MRLQWHLLGVAVYLKK